METIGYSMGSRDHEHKRAQPRHARTAASPSARFGFVAQGRLAAAADADPGRLTASYCNLMKKHSSYLTSLILLVFLCAGTCALAADEPDARPQLSSQER